MTLNILQKNHFILFSGFLWLVVELVAETPSESTTVLSSAGPAPSMSVCVGAAEASVSWRLWLHQHQRHLSELYLKFHQLQMWWLMRAGVIIVTLLTRIDEAVTQSFFGDVLLWGFIHIICPLIDLLHLLQYTLKLKLTIMTCYLILIPPVFISHCLFHNAIFHHKVLSSYVSFPSFQDFLSLSQLNYILQTKWDQIWSQVTCVLDWWTVLSLSCHSMMTGGETWDTDLINYIKLYYCKFFFPFFDKLSWFKLLKNTFEQEFNWNT